MKYKRTHFLQLSRSIFKDERFQGLTTDSKWLYVCLNELEHRYTGRNETHSFYHSDVDVSEMSGIALRTFQRCKDELKKRGFIRTWQSKIVDKKGNDTGKTITCYTFPDDDLADGYMP